MSSGCGSRVAGGHERGDVRPAHLQVVLHEPGEVDAGDEVVRGEEHRREERGARRGEAEQAAALERSAAQHAAPPCPNAEESLTTCSYR